MTKEEAKAFLTNISYDLGTIGIEDLTVKDGEKMRDAIETLEQEPILDKIRAEIEDCLKALDNIEKSGINIYLPNEMTGRRLTYKQCLEFIDKYKAEIEPQESEG